MNAEAKVLQAVDAAQAAFRRFRELTPEERQETARQVQQELAMAPWSMVTRPNEADQHGWLGQLRDCLQRVADEDDIEELSDTIDEGLWAANELERDLRTTVGAR
jgi:hypothetical protein